MKIVGAYAQTELGHGSNVRQVPTQVPTQVRTKFEHKFQHKFEHKFEHTHTHTRVVSDKSCTHTQVSRSNVGQVRSTHTHTQVRKTHTHTRSQASRSHTQVLSYKSLSQVADHALTHTSSLTCPPPPHPPHPRPHLAHSSSIHRKFFAGDSRRPPPLTNRPMRYFAHRTRFSHMSHPTFPISHLLFLF